jgi:hypothetical protein
MREQKKTLLFSITEPYLQNFALSIYFCSFQITPFKMITSVPSQTDVETNDI